MTDSRADRSRDEGPAGEPTWQPVAAVGVMTSVVAEQLAHTRQQLGSACWNRPSLR